MAWQELATSEEVTPSASLVRVSVQPGIPDADEVLASRMALPGRYITPPAVILRLEEAWLETRMSLAVTADHQYVPDTLRSHRQALEQGYVAVGPGVYDLPDSDILEIDGQALLVGLPVGRNYFHWMLEAVARWLLARRHVSPSVRVLIPEVGPMERAALDAAGVPTDCITVLPPNSLVRVEELLVPPRGVRRSAEIFPCAVRALREMAPCRMEATERVFISRYGARWRRIENEQELNSVLERHGFRVVNPQTMTIAEQIWTFARARTILALHGAGLTNAAYAPSGSMVIELQPPALDPARMALYWNLAAAGDLQYLQIVCPEAPKTAMSKPHDRDVVVDAAHLNGVLEECLGAAV